MKKLYLCLLLSILLFSCVNEDYFGLSQYGNIKRIEVSNQAGNATIDTENKKVTIEIPAGVDLSAINIEKLELSSFATSNKTIGDKLDLNEPEILTVIAEDGSKHEWEIESFIASATPQLSNWDLNQWYKTASNYYEPGADAATTIWGTGNQGTQILNKLATIREDLGNGNFAAHMETLDNGALAGTFGAPISAGSIFTGVFNPDNIDPSNPEAAIEFGSPFTGRPKSIRVKYSYSPGAVNKDKKGNVLDYGDACDIYALFEIRLGGNTERLATAWFRSEEAQETLSSLEIPVNFGELDNSFPDYMKPVNHGFVSADSASFVLPTHITFVASSSFDGANFAGAIGSLLIIDDIEMIYE
ncbi:PCMD domain-containing protein [uncultured Draconibacterium sp.]|uniref:PCMD domain-containing protein n=1 Tax=uncultured Draconibacterium sp. TaxID=1573823 RepID=UPI0032167075